MYITFRYSIVNISFNKPELPGFHLLWEGFPEIFLRRNVLQEKEMERFSICAAL